MTDKIRTSIEWVLQQLIEAEATAFIGAERHERTDSRATQRNGHHPKLLSTPATRFGSYTAALTMVQGSAEVGMPEEE